MRPQGGPMNALGMVAIVLTMAIVWPVLAAFDFVHQRRLNRLP